MKLITHNFLACKIKGVTNGYPFKIAAEKVDLVTADFDPDFLRRMWDRIDYKVLKEAAESLGEGEGLPDTATVETLEEDESFQKAFHHALLEVVLQEGALVCPESGRRFIVKKGIPNLLLNEDEIA